MHCTMCGAVVPDGQSVCPTCGNAVTSGAPAQPANQQGGPQPMNQQMGGPMGQPMGSPQPMSQPMGNPQPMGGQQPMMNQQMGYQQQPMMNQQMGYQQQPMMNQQMGYQQQPMRQQGPAISVNVGGIKSMMNGDFVKLLGFIGAFLITLAPFLSWFNSTEYFKMSFNLFGYGKSNEEGGITVCAIFILIFGLFLITLEMADYIKSLSGIKSVTSTIPYVEVIVAAIALILLIVCFFNGDLKDAAKEDGVNRGIGFLFGLIGCLSSAAANMLRRVG
ncbi:MAG: hypothetical protein NC225_08695 [Clostridium sp.]|nr:hypothetical protein [Clostridium sp.]MCM1460095.1 hypothetical protein [Bacteroides sp.]